MVWMLLVTGKFINYGRIRWTTSPRGCYKVNIDASRINRSNNVTIVEVIRNDKGNIKICMQDLLTMLPFS